jgi:excisionase family DNA binding protein
MNDGNNSTAVAGAPMKLITPEELAEWLKVPLSWIYDRTRRSGPERLPVYKIGRYLRFSVPEIEEYLKVKAADSGKS